MGRSLLVLPDQASSREAETERSAASLFQSASDKAWDSPGLSSPAPLSLVWVRIPSASSVAGSRLRGCGRRRDEGKEVGRGGGRALKEKGRWMEEQCWEVGGGGSSCLRMDLSSSSCLRNCLFSLLRAFNWRERKKQTLKETDAQQRMCTDNIFFKCVKVKQRG